VRNTIYIIIALLIYSPCVHAKYTKAKKNSPNEIYVRSNRAHVVDNFKDGNHLKNPEWWRFGNLFLSIEKNTMADKPKYIGERSLHLQGVAQKWYVGGAGTYLGMDALGHNTMKLVIYSKGYNSAMLKIELYDDDNNNWHVDLGKDKMTPSEDDVFVFNMIVDWVGWRVVSIPLSDFMDANPSVGDNVWNPYQVSSSGGLLQLQLMLTTAKELEGQVDMMIDMIKFVRS
jgi:hypothetical protein